MRKSYVRFGGVMIVYRMTWRLPLAGLVAFSHLHFRQIWGPPALPNCARDSVRHLISRARIIPEGGLHRRDTGARRLGATGLSRFMVGSERCSTEFRHGLVTRRRNSVSPKHLHGSHHENS